MHWFEKHGHVIFPSSVMPDFSFSFILLDSFKICLVFLSFRPCKFGGTFTPRYYIVLVTLSNDSIFHFFFYLAIFSIIKSYWVMLIFLLFDYSINLSEQKLFIISQNPISLSQTAIESGAGFRGTMLKGPLPFLPRLQPAVVTWPSLANGMWAGWFLHRPGYFL